MKKIMFNDHYRLTEAVIKELKIQTRRLMKNQYGNLAGQIKYTKKGSSLVYVRADFDNGVTEDCPYAIGEIVAVAQSYFDIWSNLVDIGDSYTYHGCKGGFINAINYHYKGVHHSQLSGWTNKMFVKAELMPRKICILDVRAERLQDITDEDCLREGICKATIGYYIKGLIANWEKESHTEHEDGKCYKLFPTPREAFAILIDKISGKGTWNSNPYVWRIEFELVK